MSSFYRTNANTYTSFILPETVWRQVIQITTISDTRSSTRHCQHIHNHHLIAGSDVYFVKLVRTEMVYSQHQLLSLDIETDDSIVR